MIKRPLNPRFSQAVLAGRKITTIRDKPWPVGVPIMLYNWSGLPYRSKQVDVAPVIVEFVQGIDINHEPMGAMFSTAYVAKRPLFGTEGFGSHREMEQWFEAIIKPGQTVTKSLMRFRLLNAKCAATGSERKDHE